jgi:hypothetical protein
MIVNPFFRESQVVGYNLELPRASDNQFDLHRALQSYFSALARPAFRVGKE